MSDHHHAGGAGPAQTTANEADTPDRTHRYAGYAVLGAIFFPPVGVVYGFRALGEARRSRKPRALAYFAIGLVTLSVISYSLLLAGKTG